MKQTFMTKKFYSMHAGGTLSCMVVSVLIILDTIMAGLFFGENAVSGINLVSPLYSLASFFSLFFALGVPISYSAAVGKFKKKEADRIFGFGVVMTLVTGVILSILTLFLGRYYLRFFGADPLINLYANEYLSLMPFLFLLLPFQNLINAMIFTDGDEDLSVMSSIAEATGNIFFSILLVNKIGIAGIAAGSIIGAILSIAVCFLHFFNKDNTLRLRPYFSKRLLVSAANYGITDSGIWLFMAVSSAILNKYVTVFFGAGLLVLASVFNLMRELQLFFDGIGEAICPIIGIYYSEKCYTGVKKIWSVAKRTAFIEGVAVGVLCFLLSGIVPSVLGITNPRVARLAVFGVRVISLSLPAVSYIYILTSYYIVIDKVGLSLLVTALRYSLLTLPFALIGGLINRGRGMFTGIAIAPYAAWLITFLYIFFKYGKDAYPLFLNEKEKAVNSFLFEFRALPEEITKARDEAEGALTACGFEKQSVLRALLLFEEIFMLIYERNKDRDVCAECSIVVIDNVLKLVGRDDGKEIDLSDEDMKIESFRSYILSRLISERDTASKHLIAMSFNRNMFEMSMEREGS